MWGKPRRRPTDRPRAVQGFVWFRYSSLWKWSIIWRGSLTSTNTICSVRNSSGWICIIAFAIQEIHFVWSAFDKTFLCSGRRVWRREGFICSVHMRMSWMWREPEELQFPVPSTVGVTVCTCARREDRRVKSLYTAISIVHPTTDKRPISDRNQLNLT